VVCHLFLITYISSILEVLMKLFILFAAILSFIGIVASAPTTDTFEKRQQFIVQTTVGLGTAIEQDLLGLANALVTGGDPTPWINDMESQYQTVIKALVEVKPVANAPQKDDIVDISVQIIVDTLVTMTAQPLTLVLILLEPALDNAISQWLLATNGTIPGILNDISQNIAPSNYIHLLNLNLVLTLNILGLGNLLGGLLGGIL